MTSQEITRGSDPEVRSEGDVPGVVALGGHDRVRRNDQPSGLTALVAGYRLTEGVERLVATPGEWSVRVTVTRTEIRLPTSADRTEYAGPEAHGMGDPLRSHW